MYLWNLTNGNVHPAANVHTLSVSERILFALILRTVSLWYFLTQCIVMYFDEKGGIIMKQF